MASTLLIRVGRRAPEVRVDDLLFGLVYMVCRMFALHWFVFAPCVLSSRFWLTVMPLPLVLSPALVRQAPCAGTSDC